MPFCHGSIVAPRPTHPHRWKCTQVFPNEPKTIGEHLKARRLALHVFQTAVAKQIGVEKTSIQNWERGICHPVPRYYPAIIKFLGYVPFGHDGSPSRIIRWLWLCAGWTQDELATMLGCGITSIWQWETGRQLNQCRWNRAVAKFKDRLQRLGLVNLATAELETLRH